MTAISLLMTVLTIGQKDATAASLEMLQSRVAATKVSLAATGAAPQLVASPVFRYSDQLRHITDAGLWIWIADSCPVLALKVEHYEPGVHPQPWLSCVASLSTGLPTAEWEPGRTFQAKKSAIVWQALPDPPADTRAARLIQMRDIARRFSAELVRMTSQEERSQMRLLPRPLYRYGDTAGCDGALFGFTGTGTNPDLLLLLDLAPDNSWQFGLAGMTAEGLTVRFGEQTVWSSPHTAGKGRVFDTWAYYFHD